MSREVGAEFTLRLSRTANARTWEQDRWFFLGMAIAALLTVFAGFARTYYMKEVFGTPPLPRLLHLHGSLFSTWVLLFVTQTSLVAARRTDIHRRLGLVGGVLAAVMAVVGMVVAIDAVHRGHPTAPGLPPPLVFFIVPFGDILLFTGFAGTGLYFRHRPQTHKRLMLLATIGLLTAAIARLPGIIGTGPLVFFGLTDLFVVVCWLYDRLAHGRVHPAFLWGGLLLIASQGFRLWFGGTHAWLTFARWLTG